MRYDVHSRAGNDGRTHDRVARSGAVRDELGSGLMELTPFLANRPKL